MFYMQGRDAILKPGPSFVSIRRGSALSAIKRFMKNYDLRLFTEAAT
jgi:hypothetical protein